MENNLPSDDFRPEDEYPDLDAQPVSDVSDSETTAEQQTVASEQPSGVPQPPFPPQSGIPYMTYPIFPPMPGTPYPPQQPQESGQSPSLPQGVYYIPVYAPYPQQQGVVPPAAPQAAETQPPTEGTPDDAVPEEIKKPASTGTKAFLIILTALMLAMVIGFSAIVIIGFRHYLDKNEDNNSSSASESSSKNDPFRSSPDDDKLPNSDKLPNLIPNNGSDQGGIDLKHTEEKETITLVADDGATQTRDTDNPDSIGKPDKDAKGIEIKGLPKDADKTSKYTANSAFKTLADSVVTVNCYEDKITENIFDIVSSGSGTIISSDGYIVTNGYVLLNSKQYVVDVTLNNGKHYQAKIIGYDTWTDLAVLKIDAKDLKPAEFGDSDQVKTDDKVIVLSSPGDNHYKIEMDEAAIEKTDSEFSTVGGKDLIQCDIAIDPDCTGGPLCNLYGQVIGVTSAKTSAEPCVSIPSVVVQKTVKDLLRYGYMPDRPRIGFTGYETNPDNYYNIPGGVIVDEISDDGALKGSGVERGDIITAIDGEDIRTFEDIYSILSEHKAGDKVKLTIYRLDDKSVLGMDKTEGEKEKDKK